jgi:SAM-dependent methyltransferase
MLATLRRLRDPWEKAYRHLPPDRRTREDLLLDEAAVLSGLLASEVPSGPWNIDIPAFRAWRKRADFERRHPAYYPENLEEKSLEHFVTAQLAGLRRGRVVVEVDSHSDASAEVHERVHGCKVLRQSRAFAPGRHGRHVGGDPARMDLPEDFADAITLHCAFEHFEGDGDSAFIREAERVLKPGGVLVIAPLYLAQHYACLTFPPLVSEGDAPPFEDGMRIHALRHWRNRFGRFYDLGHFVERVWHHRGSLDGRVLVVENFRDVHPSVYLRYVLVMRKATA